MLNVAFALLSLVFDESLEVLLGDEDGDCGCKRDWVESVAKRESRIHFSGRVAIDETCAMI